MIPNEVNESEAVVEAKHIMVPLTGRIMRTYEDGFWWFIVFKPLNAPYEKNPDWFRNKGLDHCRKMVKHPSTYISTREINASKVHVNMIVHTSTNDVLKRHDTIYCNKYKIHVSVLLGLADRQRVLAYITKESKDRTFERYLDYNYY